jgi:hypothetical protein
MIIEKKSDFYNHTYELKPTNFPLGSRPKGPSNLKIHEYMRYFFWIFIKVDFFSNSN